MPGGKTGSASCRPEGAEHASWTTAYSSWRSVVATEYSVPSPATRNASYNCLPQTLKVMTWNCGHGELSSATMCRFVTRARPRVADDANSSAKSHLPISAAFDNGHYARAILWEEVK